MGGVAFEIKEEERRPPPPMRQPLPDKQNKTTSLFLSLRFLRPNPRLLIESNMNSLSFLSSGLDLFILPFQLVVIEILREHYCKKIGVRYNRHLLVTKSSFSFIFLFDKI